MESERNNHPSIFFWVYTERGYKLNFLVRQETQFFQKTWFLKSSIYSRVQYISTEA